MLFMFLQGEKEQIKILKIHFSYLWPHPHIDINNYKGLLTIDSEIGHSFKLQFCQHEFKELGLFISN